MALSCPGCNAGPGFPRESGLLVASDRLLVHIVPMASRTHGRRVRLPGDTGTLLAGKAVTNTIAP